MLASCLPLFPWILPIPVFFQIPQVGSVLINKNGKVGTFSDMFVVSKLSRDQAAAVGL